MLEPLGESTPTQDSLYQTGLIAVLVNFVPLLTFEKSQENEMDLVVLHLVSFCDEGLDTISLLLFFTNVDNH